MANVRRCGANSLSRLAATTQDGAPRTTRRERIVAIVAAWPELRPDQLDRVALLLRHALAATPDMAKAAA
jgi:hypothetical protein